MRILRIYSLNIPIYHIAVFTTVTILYITFLVLIYLINGSLYLLIFTPVPLSPASGNHKSNFFFLEVWCL